MYSYEEFYSYGMEPTYGTATSGMIFPYIMLTGAVLLVMFIGYLFSSFGLYGIAKRTGKDTPWLAFIPYARTYLHGELADGITIFKKELKHPGLWLLLSPIVLNVVMTIVSFVALALLFAYGATLDAMGYYMEEELLSAVYVFIIVIGLIAVLFDAFIKLLTGLVNYNIHKRFVPQSSALAHMLLGLFVPLYQSIYFFVLKRRIPLDKRANAPSITWQAQSITPGVAGLSNAADTKMCETNEISEDENKDTD